MSPAYGFRAGLRQAEMQNLALGNEILDRAGDVLNRHIGIDTVLVIQVDTVGLQPFERFLYDFLDVFWTAVQGNSAVDSEAKFACDLHLVTEWLERFADQLFISIWTIYFGGVVEGDAVFEGRTKGMDALIDVRRRAVVRTDAHAARPDGGDFEVTEMTLSHFLIPFVRCF